MDTVRLGRTNIEVSRLCFGSLVMGPLQVGLSEEEGAEIILEALRRGVNFIDTAELYGTYGHIRKAIHGLSGIPGIKQPVIASKSYAYSREGARDSLEKARRELDMDVLDIFLMHEQETRLTLRGHREALEYYLEAREKGIIRAVGVSTHTVEAAAACAEMPEIDVLHPLINIQGLGIGDGDVYEMLAAVRKAFDAGKGIYSMKALGGGNLSANWREALDFVMGLPYVHAIAMGMQSVEEVIANTAVFNKEDLPDQVLKKLDGRKKRLHIDYWCEGCGGCVERCGSKALTLVGGKAVVDPGRCLLCGYCSSACPCFAIKMV